MATECNLVRVWQGQAKPDYGHGFGFDDVEHDHWARQSLGQAQATLGTREHRRTHASSSPLIGLKILTPFYIG